MGSGSRVVLVAVEQVAAFRRLWRRLPGDLRKKLRSHRLISHASAISYQLLLALLPLGLFGLALASLLGQRELWHEELAQQARDHLSPATFRLLDGTVEQIMTSKRTLWLTAGLALALWKLSAAARVTMDALDEIYDTGTRLPFARRLLRSIALAVAAGACLIVAAGVVIAGGRAAREDLPAALSFIVRWGLAIALIMLAVALILRYAPARRISMAWITMGSALVTAAWIATSLLFGFYAEKVASWETLFGGLTTAIVLMLYLYVSAIAFLVCAQLDALLVEETERVTAGGRAPSRARGGHPAPAADAPRRASGA